MPGFQLISDYPPRGDQPRAISALSAGVKEGERYQTLLGVTGSGKTFTIANVIARVQKPTLVMAHNKTLAAQRVEIVRDLRLGKYDVLIGINLLREGLDIPEASLVGILDADKESFLRSHVSLIQTLGRVARHLHGKGILYADHLTQSIKIAMDETQRRREIQRRYNEEHGITPETVRTRIRDLHAFRYEAAPLALPLPEAGRGKIFSREEIRELMAQYSKRMKQAAQELHFEEAAAWRDKLALLKEMDLEIQPPYQGLVEKDRGGAFSGKAGRKATKR